MLEGQSIQAVTIDWKQTSWLFGNVAEEFNSDLP